MNAPRWLGIVLFFLVPLALWLICAAAIRKKDRAGQNWAGKLLAFISGSDNRLSLSRLQAFVWTLVIFGSFAAAMAVHPLIGSATKEQMEQIGNELTAAEAALTSKKAVLDGAQVNFQTALNEQAVLQEEFEKAQDDVAVNGENEERKAKFEAARSALALKIRERERIEKAKNKADVDYQSAAASRKSLSDASVKHNWVIIPAELLALAGIAIGSGVFSSLISNLNGEDKTACVTGLAIKPGSALITSPPLNDNIIPGNYYLEISGRDFGGEGKVRLRHENDTLLRLATTPYWKTDGTLIYAELDQAAAYNFLIIDTPNGKLSHEVEINVANMAGKLQDFKTNYEFADLFRDDKNPVSFDLMKFQMFGWTVIAVVIYSILFLTEIRNENNIIQSLPLVPASIVILTGLSQAGYLGSKAISPTRPGGGSSAGTST